MICSVPPLFPSYVCGNEKYVFEMLQDSANVLNNAYISQASDLQHFLSAPLDFSPVGCECPKLVLLVPHLPKGVQR